MKKIISIEGSNLVTYTVKGNRLVEEGYSFMSCGLGRSLNLKQLGRILRSTKRNEIAIYYSSRTLAYRVPVTTTSKYYISIGCVRFRGENARVLRRVALAASRTK